MTEQEAIATILVNQRFMRNVSPPITNAQAVIDGLKASRIEEPIAGTMEGWISVAERLPDHHMRVLAIVKFDDRRVVYVEHYTPKYNRWFDDAGIDLETEVGCVTHWMPIPPLPTDEKAKE